MVGLMTGSEEMVSGENDSGGEVSGELRQECRVETGVGQVRQEWRIEGKQVLVRSQLLS